MVEFVNNKICLILTHPDLSADRVVLSWLWINGHIWNHGESIAEAMMKRIKSQLVRYEGLQLKQYRCVADKLTIGYVLNLDDCGISKTEAYVLL